MSKICNQHAHTIKWQMKYVAKHAQPILASIKQLAMTRSSIYEYIDLGVKWEHLIIGHTHRLSTSGVTTFT